MATRKSRAVEAKNQTARLPYGRVAIFAVIVCVFFSCAKKHETLPAVIMTESSKPASIPLAETVAPPAPQAMIATENTPGNPQKKTLGTAPRAILPQNYIDPASTLAQADRHLTARPLDIHTASDFVLGPLFSDASEPADLISAKNALIKALLKKKLPLDFLSAPAREILPVLLSSTFEQSPDITEIRLGSIQPTPDQNKSIQLRLYTETGCAEGLVILSQIENSWKIEHISLDSAALSLPYAPIKDFDPYGILVSPR